MPKPFGFRIIVGSLNPLPLPRVNARSHVFILAGLCNQNGFIAAKPQRPIRI